MLDLSKFRKDHAIFLPAISSYFCAVMGGAKHREDYMVDGRVPEGFENGLDGLNFSDTENGYIFYDKALYSAGHAYLEEGHPKAETIEYIIHDRDRKKVELYGDSGGFQIGKGVINFDWEHFFEKPGDMSYVGDADRVRENILGWLCRNTDWAMTLDVPTWAYIEKTARERTGLRSFDECLNATLHNLDYFAEHRTGDTKFLNILQGTTWEDTQKWYDAVKDYPFEGWAMGGNNIRDMEIALKRLIIMRDEGKLEGETKVHFLGTSHLLWSVLLTDIQRNLRKHVNPDITVSFDAATPFVAAANGRVYSATRILSTGASYVQDRTFDDKLKRYANTDIPFPFESEVGRRMLVKDVLFMAPNDLNKHGKIARSGWDSISYILIMIHNLEQHIRCIQRLTSLTDFECVRFQPDWRGYTKTKQKKAQLSLWVPRELIYWRTFIDELFASDKPMTLIEEARPLLRQFDNIRYEDGNTDLFQSLFSEETDHVDDYENDDAVLEALEIEAREEIDRMV
jgi:hypothetical protein